MNKYCTDCSHNGYPDDKGFCTQWVSGIAGAPVNCGCRCADVRNYALANALQEASDIADSLEYELPNYQQMLGAAAVRKALDKKINELLES